MSRFASPNLAGLPPPDALGAVDYEAMLAARIADLKARLTAAGLPDVAARLDSEAEPLTIGQETDSHGEMLLRQRVNEAVLANMIAYATDANLDHLVATRFGISRLVVTPADPDAVPPVEAVMERDEDFRDRALLSMEAHSSAGPEGGYAYFALQASAEVHDVAVYGEEDEAEYIGGDPVLAPEVLVTILGKEGVVASSGLRATVLAALNQEEVRPVGDKVTVESATVETYAVVGVVRHAPGADPAPLLALAHAQVAAYAAARYRIGRIAQRLGIGAAMKVTDVEEIVLTLPAADVDPGSKGAAWCTSITLTAEVAEDDWRS